MPRRAEAGALRRRPAVVPLRARAPARAPLAIAARPRSSPARACTSPPSYDADGFRARHGIDAAVRAVRGPARARKGWDWLLAAFHFAIRQYDLPFDLVTTGVSPANAPADVVGTRARASASSTRPRSPNAFAAASRLRAAEHQRELLAHDHGVVAGRHSGARSRREATCCAGTATDRAAASPSPTSSSSRSVSRSSRPRPTTAARLAKAGREYVLANYQLGRRARRDGDRPRRSSRCASS